MIKNNINLLFLIISLNEVIIFLKNNYSFIDLKLFTNLILIFFIFYFLLFFIYKLITATFKNIDKEKTKYAIAILSLSFFHYDTIDKSYNLPELKNLLNLIIVFLIFFSIFYLLNKYKLTKKFIYNFLIISILINIALIFKNINDLSNYNNEEKNKLIYNKVKEKRNVYFFLINSFPSTEYLNSFFNKDFKNHKIFNEKKLNFHQKESLSITTTTYDTMTSIFNLKNITVKNNKYYRNPFNSFPNIMINENKNNLINVLKSNNYNFVWFGNSYWNCKKYNANLCPEVKAINKKKFYFDINLAILFLEKTPLTIVMKRSKFLQQKKAESKFSFEENNPFENLKQYILNNKYNNKFIFINDISLRLNFIPKDCTKKHRSNFKLSKVECMLDRLNNLVNTIYKHDPNSLIIIEGDHGSNYKNKDIYNTDRLRKFSMSNLADICFKKGPRRLTNLEHLIIALNCTLEKGIKIKEEFSYSYIINKKNKLENYNKVIRYN